MAVLNHIGVNNIIYEIKDASAVPKTRTINNK